MEHQTEAMNELEREREESDRRRRDNIALKHENKLSVHPFTGEKMTGAVHAPMLYAKDPRSDLPATLHKRIQESISGSDKIIVAGWMEH